MIPLVVFAVVEALLIGVLLWALLRRPAPREVDLTAAAYLRWLGAGRPDLRWFLALPVADQQQLEQLGLAFEGVGAADDPEIEALRQLGATVLRRMGGETAPAVEPVPPRPTMGGIAARRKQAETEAVPPRRADATFLGRKPREAS